MIIACWGPVLNLAHGEQAPLNPHLEALRPLLGKTWKGVFKDSKPDKPIVDVARWERTLNGQAVRLTHSINQGLYGGESVFIWDQKKCQVTSYYFTTAGFMTTGTMEVKDGKMFTREEVQGEAGGVTAVRGTNEIQPDGKFHVRSEHLKNGQWEPGHEATYEQDDSAQVVFK